MNCAGCVREKWPCPAAVHAECQSGTSHYVAAVPRRENYASDEEHADAMARWRQGRPAIYYRTHQLPDGTQAAVGEVLPRAESHGAEAERADLESDLAHEHARAERAEATLAAIHDAVGGAAGDEPRLVQEAVADWERAEAVADALRAGLDSRDRDLADANEARGRAETRAGDLEARLADLARVHAATLDRLHEVERRELELERRLALALERGGAGGHTAHRDGGIGEVAR